MLPSLVPSIEQDYLRSVRVRPTPTRPKTTGIKVLLPGLTPLSLQYFLLLTHQNLPSDRPSC